MDKMGSIQLLRRKKRPQYAVMPEVAMSYGGYRERDAYIELLNKLSLASETSGYPYKPWADDEVIQQNLYRTTPAGGMGDSEQLLSEGHYSLRRAGLIP